MDHVIRWETVFVSRIITDRIVIFFALELLIVVTMETVTKTEFVIVIQTGICLYVQTKDHRFH
jgi:hypothetical protein